MRRLLRRTSLGCVRRRRWALGTSRRLGFPFSARGWRRLLLHGRLGALRHSIHRDLSAALNAANRSEPPPDSVLIEVVWQREAEGARGAGHYERHSDYLSATSGADSLGSFFMPGWRGVALAIRGSGCARVGPRSTVALVPTLAPKKKASRAAGPASRASAMRVATRSKAGRGVPAPGGAGRGNVAPGH